MSPFRFSVAVLLAGLVGVVGCGGSSLAEVEGTLKVKGKPVDKIRVEFWPEGKGPRSSGETDKDGRFTLTTDDGKKGAVVGSHRIVLRDTGILGDKFLGRAGEDVDMAKGKKPRISGLFSDPNSTPLKRDVKPSKNDFSDLEATP